MRYYSFNYVNGRSLNKKKTKTTKEKKKYSETKRDELIFGINELYLAQIVHHIQRSNVPQWPNLFYAN